MDFLKRPLNLNKMPDKKALDKKVKPKKDWRYTNRFAKKVDSNSDDDLATRPDFITSTKDENTYRLNPQEQARRELSRQSKNQVLGQLIVYNNKRSKSSKIPERVISKMVKERATNPNLFTFEESMKRAEQVLDDSRDVLGLSYIHLRSKYIGLSRKDIRKDELSEDFQHFQDYIGISAPKN